MEMMHSVLYCVYVLMYNLCVAVNPQNTASSHCQEKCYIQRLQMAEIQQHHE